LHRRLRYCRALRPGTGQPVNGHSITRRLRPVQWRGAAASRLWGCGDHEGLSQVFR
jgi:hypothetical protein